MIVVGRLCERCGNVVAEVSLIDYSIGMADFHHLACEDCFDELAADVDSRGIGNKVFYLQRTGWSWSAKRPRVLVNERGQERRLVR